MEPGNSQVTIRLPDPDADLESCPVRTILDQVGDKWTVLVISYLAVSSLRFSELRRRVDGVSQRMLTLTVRTLERDGLLLRTVYPTIPPKVEYSLTALGVSLVRPVQTLVGWAIDNRDEIERARTVYDERAAQPVRAIHL